MRRCRFACVGALLLALLLTGCGKAGTAPEDGGADFSETEQVETPEAADALTVKEIALVNEAFAWTWWSFCATWGSGARWRTRLSSRP